METMERDEFARILGTFADPDFTTRIEKAKSLLDVPGTSVSRHGNPVPTVRLKRIYARRATNPDLHPALGRQAIQLAQVADQFPAERWLILALDSGQTHMTLFTNEEGVGRVCIDFDAQFAVEE
jgi:hypothetical protein